MERLTAKKEDRYFENEEFWVDAEQPSIDKIDDVYFKLAEFEDLMEEHDLNSVEQLDDLIIEYHYNRDEISFLKEEKEILEDRWEKLKEWSLYMCYFELADKMQELEDGSDTNVGGKE